MPKNRTKNRTINRTMNINKNKNKTHISKRLNENSKKKKKISVKSIKQKMNNIPYSQFNSKRKYLLHKCGLPDIPETGHCFNDRTHHTCCELSKEAREYADRTNNPIGKLSEDVFTKLPNNHPKKEYYLKNNKRPWCTCFGSKVCGNYGDKFNQSTKIDFISSPNENMYARNIYGSEGCEEYVRNKFNVMSHGTPGVNQSQNSLCEPSKINLLKFNKF